ncbi:hypothetical protein [Actinomadura rupiterrae]|nr:hypothetical protein [Actinomadura rupiterrae]MCP2337904.1 hypothetical protein [Actinomadura rupiterrae]
MNDRMIAVLVERNCRRAELLDRIARRAASPTPPTGDNPDPVPDAPPDRR